MVGSIDMVKLTADECTNSSVVKKTAKSAITVMDRLEIGRLAAAMNSCVRWLSYQTHRLQLLFHYAKPHETEWFDHFIDVHYTWEKTQSSYPWERGIMNALAIRQGARVLELCSGDGFNARFFYAEKAASLYGIDINKHAVSHAQRYHASEKIMFKQGNILTDVPDETYDNIIWDASLYMFSNEELAQVVENCHGSLSSDGIMSGHAAYDFNPKMPEVPQAIALFEGILKRFFKNVKVNINTTNTRLNMHFYASDDMLPFDSDWQQTFLQRKL